MTNKGFKVLRAVVYLTYDDREIRNEDEAIEAIQTAYQAGQDIMRVLSRERHGLEYKPHKIEVAAKYVPDIWDRLDSPDVELRREGWR